MYKFFCGIFLIGLFILPGCGDGRVNTTAGSVLYQRTVLHAEKVLETSLGIDFIAGFNAGMEAADDNAGVAGVTREEAAYVTGFLRARELINADDQNEARRCIEMINELIATHTQ